MCISTLYIINKKKYKSGENSFQCYFIFFSVINFSIENKKETFYIRWIFPELTLLAKYKTIFNIKFTNIVRCEIYSFEHGKKVNECIDIIPHDIYSANFIYML